ncbi:hypothetical protein ACHAWU_004696 [Discostella pseudostelligera]|uniref:Uncharacterized protein n=1 Tax=Discostella pseudostelligera TaxID=259834 RepID=A0ABD3NDB5_9STRA
MAHAFPAPATAVQMVVLFQISVPLSSLPSAMDTSMKMERTGLWMDASGITQIILMFKNMQPMPIARCLSALPMEELMDHAIAKCIIPCVKAMGTSDSTIQDQYRADHPRCGLNGTCYPSMCTCYANYMGAKLLYCGAPLNDICNGIVTDANGKQWGFEGCYRDYPDYPDFQLYTKTAYCEMAKCVVDGGSIVPCSCQMYHSLCDVFGDVRKYDVSQKIVLQLATIPNREGFCTIDRCCQSKSDDAGMASCFESTNSTPTTSPTTSTNNTSSSSSALRTNSAGAMSLLVTAAAVLSLGCDAM